MSDLSFVSFSGTTRPTAFGIYDSDSTFQADADKVVYFVQRHLGAPVLESELDLRQIWSCFENAAIEYSTTINSAHARNILLDLLGQTTGSLSGTENSFPVGNQTEFARNMGMQYSSEIGVGGSDVWYTGSVNLTVGQQKYDLWSAVSGALTGANANKRIIVRKIHHYEPTAAFRFFDTTSVLNFLGNALSFESYSPETIFYLLPIWEDVLRGTQLSLNQRVRRSNYSFDLKRYELTLYPTPVNNTPSKLYFEYTISPRDPNNVLGHQSQGVISNVSNVSFGHISYSDINSIGKTWIWKMTLAMCKEALGGIRAKYGNLPVPGSNITLNGSELINLARDDQANLRLELKELLDAMSYRSLMAERNELEQSTQNTFRNVPMMIYISR